MRVTVLTGGATAERAVAFAGAVQIVAALRQRGHTVSVVDTASGLLTRADEADRKSTRLNSSHQIISYAVFCLKKKTHDTQHQAQTRAATDRRPPPLYAA